MDWYLSLALILVGFGTVLLAAEFFLPTGGFLIVASVACYAGAVGIIFMYGETIEAVAAIIALCIGLPIVWLGLFRVWSGMALKSGLDPTVANEVETVSALDALRGQFGRTVTPMRPSGAVQIDGRRIDAMTEGMMLDANIWVKCIDIRAGRVIVRQVDPPTGLPSFDLEDLGNLGERN